MPRPKTPHVSPRTIDSSILDTYIPTPPLNFSGTALSLADMVKKYRLPRVIKGDTKTCPSRYSLKSNLDISKPLLAYMSRSVRKVCAHSLRFDNNKCDFITVGNGLLIPDDYPGWFAVMGAPGVIKKSHQTIPHYNKLSCLAMSKCSHFLVGGKDCIRGAVIERTEDGDTRAIPCQVFPGTILRKVGLYQEDISASKENKKKKKKNKELPRREFLKCYDENDREMFIYTHQTGVFYVISRDNKTHSPQILQMKDILARISLPLVVKLIYGRVPTTPCGFMQVLLLTDSGMSNTLVASTLLGYRNINFEIPLGTDMKFHIADDTPGLKGSKAYINALNMCKEKALSYIKDMKVVFGDPQLQGEGHDEVTIASSSSNQHAKPIENNKSKQTNDIPVVLRNPSIPEEDSGVERDVTEHLPKRSASTFSRSSYLQLMAERITVNRDSFILTEHPVLPPVPPIKPQNKKILLEPGNSNNAVPSNMALVTAYEPPKRATIPSSQSRDQHPVHKKDAGVQVELQGEGKIEYTYDNASNSGKTDNNSLSQYPTSADLNPNGSDSHCSSKEKKKITSTITIPSRSGHPVRSPVIDRKQSDYLSMKNGHKNPPKPCRQYSRTCSFSSQPDADSSAPKLPERRGQAKYSDSSSIPDSDSLTSISDDSWSISEWSTDEENIYVNLDFQRLMRIESEPSEDGQQEYDLQLQHQDHCSGLYIAMQDLPQTHGYSSATGSLLQATCKTNMNNPTNEYLVPLDEADLQPNVYEQANEQAGTVSVHGYSMFSSNNSPDSGVCEELGYTYLFDSSQSVATDDCKDTVNSGCQPINGPQLPNRTPLLQKPKNIGQAVLRSIPAPSKTTFSQANKNDLILELKKAGITASTELALVGLQTADIISLLSKEDDFDDELVALLPQVGRIDLMRIAVCLRGIKLSI